MLEFLSPIAEVIEDAKNGKMFILIDDEDRENEGDLVIPAEYATADVINFMAKYARGLICLPLEQQIAERLNLKMMSQDNDSRFKTAFTVSIEAREGISTGISAHDRAKTVKVAIADNSSTKDICSPGHVFPLIAKDGGVLVRAGHTEASVDIARLAGLKGAAVICEVMNEDGTMARLNDLIPFAKEHGLKIATIADLIAYRRFKDKLIERVTESEIDTDYAGKMKVVVYKNKFGDEEHLALIKGEVPKESCLVRMHSVNILSDIISDSHGNKNQVMRKALEMINKEGAGVVVVLRNLASNAISQELQSRENKYRNYDLRNYGIGAQILLDLGVSSMRLITNTPKQIVGLEGYGLKVESFVDLGNIA